MTRETALLTELRRTLDGQTVDQAFARDCPSCGREYAAGDWLVVYAEREPTATTWDEVSVVCADCETHEFETDRPSREQVLVGVDLVATPVTRVLDGDGLEFLKHAPATEPAE